MWFFNYSWGKIFESIFFPFRHLNPWWGMIFISLLTGLFMLAVFKYTSNQKGISQVKNKIKAHLLEIRLFKDNFALSLKAQGNILRYNLKYISYSFKPMLVMIIPLILILIQLNLWFGYHSLEPGQKAIVKVKLKKEYNPLDLKLKIDPSPGFRVDSPPLRIEEEKEVNWRIQAKKKGIYSLVIKVDNQSYQKNVAISQNSLTKISPAKVNKNFWAELLYPGEQPLSSDSPLESIEITYSSKKMNLFGLHLHWLIVYFVLSIIFGFGLKGFLKVQI